MTTPKSPIAAAAAPAPTTSPTTSAAAPSPTQRRDVVFTGGISPAAMAVAIVILLAPGVLSPLVFVSIDPQEAGFAFVPSLFWLIVGAVGMYAAVWRPLRVRRTIERGELVDGTVIEIRARPKSRSGQRAHVVVRFVGHDGAEYTTTATTTGSPLPGDRVQVAYEPLSPRDAVVVDYAPWRIRDETSPSASAVSALRMTLLLALIAASFAAMMYGLGLPSPDAPLSFTPAWMRAALPISLVLAVVLAIANARRRRLAQMPAFWDGALFVAAALFANTATLALDRALPAVDETVPLRVTASFCLELQHRSDRCLVELRGDAPLRLVSAQGPSHGDVIDVHVRRGALGGAELRSAQWQLRTWTREDDVAGLFIDKNTKMSRLIERGEVRAVGAFDDDSVVKAELQRLGVPIVPRSKT